MDKTLTALKLAEEAMTSNMRLLGAKALAAIREALADHIADTGKMIGCAYCDNPLFAGTKCNNCGRVTIAEPANTRSTSEYSEPVKQEPGFYGRAAARLSQRVKELELEQSGKWRDHVEHRMLTWKTSHMNESGDQLSLEDFMDEHILDDLIDFVCDEYTARTKDLTDDEIMDLVRDECVDMRWPSTPLFIARAIIAAFKEKNR